MWVKLTTNRRDQSEEINYWFGLRDVCTISFCANQHDDERGNDNIDKTEQRRQRRLLPQPTPGTVTTYEPGKTVVVKSDQGPVSFALGTAARVVDGAGKVVTAPLRAGQKVRVYYTGPTESRTVERVIVED